VWNIVLVSATFFLCIFGTFLTRSGVFSSVHAFAQSPLGKYFVVFLAIGIGATIYLILNRLDFLKSEAELESVLSRESSFLFNNLILLASCFAVLWGTLFPVISEAVTGEKISVDAPFFNRVNVPIAMFLLLLTGVGPLIAWRRSSFESLKRAFFWPALGGVLVSATLFALGVRHLYALVSFMLCTFVAITVVLEFFKGANAIRSKDHTNIVSSMIELTHRNTRRYGGYLVHMGVVLMFIGFTGKAFDKDTTVEVAQGESIHLGSYDLKVAGIEADKNENYSWGKLHVAVSKNGEDLGEMVPERRFYTASRQPTTEVAIRRRLNEDLYINFAGMSNDGKKVVVQAYVFPLVSCIWCGFWVLFFGTAICLVPSKTKLVWARTEVLAVSEKKRKTEVRSQESE